MATVNINTGQYTSSDKPVGDVSVVMVSPWWSPTMVYTSHNTYTYTSEPDTDWHGNEDVWLYDAWNGNGIHDTKTWNAHLSHYENYYMRNLKFSVLVGAALKQAAEMKHDLSTCNLIPTLAVLYSAFYCSPY